MLFVLVCYILSGLHLMSYVACLLGWDLSIIPKRSKAVIWKAKLAWAMAKTFEGDHRGPFIRKRQFSYSLHRAKRDWYCFGISRLSIQTRSGSAGCKFAEAFKATRRGGPLRMSELCSMCRKMATVQGLESFIFRESLEDNCFMHFTEVLADWFHLHRVRAVTDAGDNCVGRGEEVLIDFCLSWHPALDSGLGTFGWDCCYWQPYGFPRALSTRFCHECYICVFSHWEESETESRVFGLTVFSEA